MTRIPNLEDPVHCEYDHVYYLRVVLWVFLFLYMEAKTNYENWQYSWELNLRFLSCVSPPPPPPPEKTHIDCNLQINSSFTKEQSFQWCVGANSGWLMSIIADFQEFCDPVDITVLSWNQPWWEGSHCINWQKVQSGTHYPTEPQVDIHVTLHWMSVAPSLHVWEHGPGAVLSPAPLWSRTGAPEPVADLGFDMWLWAGDLLSLSFGCFIWKLTGLNNMISKVSSTLNAGLCSCTQAYIDIYFMWLCFRCSSVKLFFLCSS